MKPNPLSALDIPNNWPKTGTLPNGKTVDLKEAWQTMNHAALSMIAVDVPDKGKTRPWSNLDGFDSFELDPDVEDGMLSREDLESNGVFDSTLEGWARDREIVLDLSKDDADTRAIRWDAYRRFLAATEW